MFQYPLCPTVVDVGGRQTAIELSDRFADWYFVISAESYDKIHLSRSDLVTTE